MRAAPCICPNLEHIEIGDVFMGTFLPYRGRGYPRKTWWKFWEKKRTRDEYLSGEHERCMAEKQCHIWKNQEFHFCGK